MKRSYVLIGIVVAIFLLAAFDSSHIVSNGGGELSERSMQNEVVNARAIQNVFDRRGTPLVWSVPSESGVTTELQYVEEQGFSHMLGDLLSEEGVHIPVDNEGSIQLTLDRELQAHMYWAIQKTAQSFNYVGGAGVIMDVETGEILSMTSYPEFNIHARISDDSREMSIYGEAADEPLLNRVTNGLFVPGSVMKPFVAIAALNEGIIDPDTKILSTGLLELPNPFKQGIVSIFHDWKAHGYVDMREAIGVSSNVYFYTVGGGFEDQEGLGIELLDEYLRMFGFGSTTGIEYLSESAGAIPTPKWKAEAFNGDEWRVGDTYLASIGQHGYQVTPLQLVRATAALANNGVLVTPTIFLNERFAQNDAILPIPEEHFESVRNGMEYAVINGTAAGLYIDGRTIAAKTGTAELDSKKEFINSFIIGYFPQDHPRFAFTIMLDRGPWGTETGAVAVARDVLTWMQENRPDYFKER